MHFKGQHAVVLGLGLTGLSLARWLTRHGARVRVADTRAAPPNAHALAGLQIHTSHVRVFVQGLASPDERALSIGLRAGID